MAKLEIEIGTTLRDALGEFGEAWKAHAAGKPIGLSTRLDKVTSTINFAA